MCPKEFETGRLVPVPAGFKLFEAHSMSILWVFLDLQVTAMNPSKSTFQSKKMPKWPTQHIRHHCGMVLKYKNLQHYKVAFSEVLKVVIVSKYSVNWVSCVTIYYIVRFFTLTTQCGLKIFGPPVTPLSVKFYDLNFWAKLTTYPCKIYLAHVWS